MKSYLSLKLRIQRKFFREKCNFPFFIHVGDTLHECEPFTRNFLGTHCILSVYLNLKVALFSKG